MRSLIKILLLLAVICLAVAVAACPKGHKSFGGLSSLSGGGAPPKEPGVYYNVGNDWHLFSAGPGTISGNTVRYGWRFTPTEQQQTAFFLPPSLVRFDPDKTYSVIEEISSVDQSKYPDFMMFEFSVSQPGLYKLSDVMQRVELTK